MGIAEVARFNEEPRRSGGVSEGRDENYPKGVTPECFYRRSSSDLAWIPAKSMRE
jgi:hypothetical protein